MGSPATNPDDQSTPRPLVVLLVDDQLMVGESVRRMIADQPDIEFHYCQDPMKAIEMANAVRPTVILQDLVMPEIDGLQLVRFYRANPATRQTPMIVLSSKEEPAIKAKAFALGANDYLVKLPDKLEVVARIRYHSQAYINLLERNEAYKRLEESQRQLAAELRQASRYAQSLLPRPLTKGDIRIDWRFVPSTHLGGDMFGYHWLDDNHFAMYLLDVSGHGVGSSLLAVSVNNLLASQALPNTDFLNPGQVLERLNMIFPMERQDDKYFTIWYGVFNKNDRTLTYSNAAHPAAILHTGKDSSDVSLQTLESVGFAVGMMDGTEFENQTVTLGPFARLLLFSDGVYEIELVSDGSTWKYDHLVEYLSSLSLESPVSDSLLGHVRSIGGSDSLADDFSIVEIWL
ncbi:SpoIIE family protein phosphatase [bacterium]|nr:SpoIIE family protein phosphatase [bacterium]